MKTFSRFVFFLFLILIVSCATQREAPKVEAPKATESEAREFKEAVALYRAKKGPLALKKFNSFAIRHPENELTNDSYFYMGQIYYDSGDYMRAARYWTAVVDSKTTSKYFDRALVSAANAQTQLGHYDEALALLARLQIREDTDPALSSQGLELSGKLKLQKSDPLGALQDILKASSLKKSPQEQQALVAKGVEIVNGNLSTSQLDEVTSSQAYQTVELPAHFRLGVLLYDQKAWSAARKHFSFVMSKYPDSEFAKRSQQYVGSVDAQERTDSNTVGVIVPLSGKYSQMGYKTLRGIQMGLGLFNKSAPSPLKLAIIDSEGNPDVARRGVERLVSEDHVSIIIGDLISKTAQAVATKSQELGVPCLTLSQKQGLTEIGSFVFRNTLTPDMQMATLVDQAMSKRGYTRFAIIFPNDSYGTEYATTFWDHVLLRGGKVTAAQTYQPEETDFRNVIERLVGTFYKEEDRGKELQLRLATWQKEQTTKSAREKPPKDLLPPVIDFDAVFIPDSPKAIGQIGPMLAYNDVDKIPLLGTNIWNTPQIVVRGNKFVENSLFVDDFFGEDSSPSMKRFTSEFQSLFNYRPDVFEVQGYDSAVLISEVLRASGYSASRSTLRDRLSTVSNIQGAVGTLKMTAQREVEKSLIPLTVTKGRIVKVELGTGPTN